MPNNNHLKLQEIAEKNGTVGGCVSVADFACYHPRLIEFLVACFPIKSVADIGCGFGQSMKHFAALGCNVIGVEFLDFAASRANVPVILHDMEKEPIILRNIDLFWSIEFVEHVSNIESTITTLTQGKMLLFSAALPNQNGHHHVSCFPDTFWIERVVARGYKHLPRLSMKCRELAGGYCSNSGMLFVRNDAVDQFVPDIGDVEVGGYSN